ncbi:MAG TPA: hypothetical protein VJS68_00310 [Thermoplasmata archaeon]|nr:hypothetical protein [Thermoplasmata archaeon]
MSGHVSADAHTSRSTSATVSVPLIVLQAALSGIGLFGMFLWIVTFDWLWFGVGLSTLLVGAVMLFVPRATGADHA